MAASSCDGRSIEPRLQSVRWTPQNRIRRPSGLTKWPFLDADEAVLAGGRVEQERDIGQRRPRRAMIHHERLEEVVVPLGEGARSGEQEEGNGFSGHGRIDRL